MGERIEAHQLEQVYANFKEVVEKHFSEKACSEIPLSPESISKAIQEFTTICINFGEQQKDQK